jgi:ABC-type amino acid transport system permease subunit
MSLSSWLFDVEPSQPGELQLVEEMGPKARRRALFATAVFVAALVGSLGWFINRFREKGQFAPELWRPFKQLEIWKFLLYKWGNEGGEHPSLWYKIANTGGLAATFKAAIVALVLCLIIGTLTAVWRSRREAPRGRDVTLAAIVFVALLASVAAALSNGWAALGVIVGSTIVAFASHYVDIQIARPFATIYVEGFRACALVLLMSFSFIVYPRVFPTWKLNTHAYFSVVTGLVLYYSTVFSEVVRSGIRSIANGQTEAALAIGLPEKRAMSLVVLPQALRRALPNLVTQSASLLKDTSLGFFVTYEELTKRAQITGEYGSNNLQSFIVAGGLYVVVIALITSFANRLKKKQR